MPARTAGGSTRYLPLVVLVLLAVTVVARTVWGWRFFARFLDDDAWPLRVADRIAAGEHIYTDIGWVYGPLPVWVIGSLFRVTRTAAWDSLVDALLCAAAVGAVWSISTRLAGRTPGSWITAWAALLGAPLGLVSYQLTAYTSAVAWGAATSLIATATALAWVQSAARLALAATFVFAAGAVLSKPEFGLAALCVLAVALGLRRPRKRSWIPLAACLATAGIFAALRLDTSTWLAWWRGYSGYDLIATGMVPVVVPDRIAASLALAAGLVACLWSRTAGAVFTAAGALGVVVLLLRDALTHRHPYILPQLLAFTWAGIVPWLGWIGWQARSRPVSPGFWVAWVFAIAVNLRFFCYGDFCAAAAAPAAALACVAVREQLVPRPSRFGLLALAVLMLSALQAEISAVTRPRGAVRFDTPLGSIRVPQRTAAAIAALGPALAAAPPGALFVSGAGAGWYLLSGRRNPTHFDSLIEGKGTTLPEVSTLVADLRANPPSAVITDGRLHGTQEYSHARLWAVLGAAYTQVASRSQWQLFVADRPRSGTPLH